MPVKNKNETFSMQDFLRTRILPRFRADLIILEIFDSRTRLALSAHSGLHAKTRQYPYLEQDPNHQNAREDKEFHFGDSSLWLDTTVHETTSLTYRQ